MHPRFWTNSEYNRSNQGASLRRRNTGNDVRSPADVGLSICLITSAICWAMNRDNIWILSLFVIIAIISICYYGGQLVVDRRAKYIEDRRHRIERISRQVARQAEREGERRQELARQAEQAVDDEIVVRTSTRQSPPLQRIKKCLATIRYTHAIGIQDTMCAICLSEFQPLDEINHLFCQHTFHSGCLKQWLEGNDSSSSPDTCPSCRQPVLADDTHAHQLPSPHRSQQHIQRASFRGFPSSTRQQTTAILDDNGPWLPSSSTGGTSI